MVRSFRVRAEVRVKKGVILTFCGAGMRPPRLEGGHVSQIFDIHISYVDVGICCTRTGRCHCNGDTSAGFLPNGILLERRLLRSDLRRTCRCSEDWFLPISLLLEW